jgi:hypothetical protein
MNKIAVLLANTFWLLVPILAFNIVFVSRLPPAFQTDVFWHDIPAWIGTPENVFRWFVLLLPLVMRLSTITLAERVGFVIYIFGTLVYFAAWGALILFPHSPWSRSAAGFMAPAYTPALWLAGISLIGDTLTIPGLLYSPWIYRILAAAFLIFHNLHAWTVFNRGH